MHSFAGIKNHIPSVSFTWEAVAATTQQIHKVKRVLVVDAYASSDLWTERFIIVENVPVNLKILAAMLKQLGIESIPAGSAKEALEQLKIRKPEMILTDLWMPEMNSTELAEHLAKSPDTAGIPVFAITADSQALGNLPETFSGILLKPVTLAALRKSLQEFPPTGK